MNKLREQVLVFLAHKVGLPYFKLIRKRPDFPYSQEALAAMPPGSVGKALYQFLHHNGLDLLPYYEKHDIKHIVLGYEPTEDGEVCLQCFMLANGRYTLPVIVAVLYGVLTMPEYWKQFRRAWLRGKANRKLHDTDWFGLIPQPLSTVQQALLVPAT